MSSYLARLSLALFFVLIMATATVRAESKNPADYPFRIRIFNRSETTFYQNRVQEEAKGEGRADLFANGEVHGVDFSYDCSEKLKNSFGHQTYPARWKKPDKELVVLLPVFGKSNTYFTCNLKTDVKDFVYTSRDGRMFSEPADKYKAWMAKHDYDPEHGKDTPTSDPPPAQTPPTTAAH